MISKRRQNHSENPKKHNKCKKSFRQIKSTKYINLFYQTKWLNVSTFLPNFSTKQKKNRYQIMCKSKSTTICNLFLPRISKKKIKKQLISNSNCIKLKFQIPNVKRHTWKDVRSWRDQLPTTSLWTSLLEFDTRLLEFKTFCLEYILILYLVFSLDLLDCCLFWLFLRIFVFILFLLWIESELICIYFKKFDRILIEFGC